MSKVQAELDETKIILVSKKVGGQGRKLRAERLASDHARSPYLF